MRRPSVWGGDVGCVPTEVEEPELGYPSSVLRVTGPSSGRYSPLLNKTSSPAANGF